MVLSDKRIQKQVFVDMLREADTTVSAAVCDMSRDEGTLSQAVRGMGLRRARYDGLPKVHLQHVLTAVAINLVRINAVLTKTPRGKTRRSNFAMLASAPRLQDQIGA